VILLHGGIHVDEVYFTLETDFVLAFPEARQEMCKDFSDVGNLTEEEGHEYVADDAAIHEDPCARGNSGLWCSITISRQTYASRGITPDNVRCPDLSEEQRELYNHVLEDIDLLRVNGGSQCTAQTSHHVVKSNSGRMRNGLRELLGGCVRPRKNASILVYWRVLDDYLPSV
jgi:hypothetical protein